MYESYDLFPFQKAGQKAVFYTQYYIINQFVSNHTVTFDKLLYIGFGDNNCQFNSYVTVTMV